jgi:hypothetical protein
VTVQNFLVTENWPKRDPVEVLAEDFLERRRRGELRSFTEYTNRNPGLADEIREVFPRSS